MIVRGIIVLALCALIAGCTFAVGISNSPDWCMNPKSTIPCP